jgi:hypothetical protein
VIIRKTKENRRNGKVKIEIVPDFANRCCELFVGSWAILDYETSGIEKKQG